MIGKPVSGDELKAVQARQAERDKFLKEVEDELRALKPGECLDYESRPEAPLWINVGLALLVDKIKGLKRIKEGTHNYVYRAK